MKALFFKYSIMLAGALALLGCTPEEIEFPEEEIIDPKVFDQSNGIISLFNEVAQGKTNLDELCFDFEYPVAFRTDSEVLLDIESKEGLLELIESQTSGFFVDQVDFPINIFLDGEKEVADDLALQDILTSCGIEPLPYLITLFHGECFAFEYPVDIAINNGNSQDISSFEALKSLFEEESSSFFLDISYPVHTTSGQSVQNDFELYQILNACRSCPDIFFTEILSGDDVILEAFIERIDEIGTFKWYVNDELIEEDGPAVEGDFLLNATEVINTPGTFEVCVVTEFEYCDEMLSFCDEIVLAERCPEAFAFEATQTNQEEDSIYYAFEIAAFDFVEDSEIKWYINDGLVQFGASEQNLVLERAFANGMYNVCAEYLSNFCLQEIEFCQSLEVFIPNEDDCPEMFFAFENVQENTYRFFADFVGIENLDWYGWFVDGSLIEEEGLLNGGDNQFEFTFNEPAIHSVCIFTETPDCPSGAEFCVEIDTR